MKNRLHPGIVAIACLFGGFAIAAVTPSPQEKIMPMSASGTFDVQLEPQPADDDAVGRMLLRKAFHGDLEATGTGQMLAARTAVEGSAGYVAMEKISGTLHGRNGTFLLQHSGTMTRGVPQLSVTVVPDSGTDELAGLAGRMTIDITDGKHFYTFEYTLPDAE